MERLRVLLGGQVGATTRRGPGIRDHLRHSHGHLRACCGVTATVAMGAAALLLLTATQSEAATQLYAEISRTLAARLSAPAALEPSVHVVNETADYEAYSNGLVVMNTWRSPSRPRASYPVFPATPGDGPQQEWRSGPAGIVYHSTESHRLDMDEEWQPDLPAIETYLLDYVRKEHLYHFLIDRTGRVFRVVPESDVAFHAGKSVWGDEKHVYVNLNASFLGVAFERQVLDTQARVTEDQIQSARLLTDMLRAKYGIPASNCVTHAQVSVNPARMIIGAHTDWAGNFPFEELGLGDNYAHPLPSIFAFGFDYDQSLVRAAGRRTWLGLIVSREEVVHRASERGLTVPQYKAELRRRYRHIIATLDISSAS